MKISGIAPGQVLQRVGPKGANVTLFGKCSRPDTPLRVSISRKGTTMRGWRERSAGLATATGEFQFTLKEIPCGGPYCLTVHAEGESASIDEFFVGDVWVLAGQSNMQGVGNLDGAAKPHPMVRAFSKRREWRLAKDPLHVALESADVCHNGGKQCTPQEGERLRKKAKKGVGIGVFFGAEMYGRFGVPQGLICTAKGGTKMVEWDPALKSRGGASLYASMIASIRATGQPVAGVLWSQGESDAVLDHAPHYTKRMRKFVATVRKELGQPSLPWILLQTARKIAPEDPNARAWMSIREQQRRLPDQIPHLETVACIDLPMDDPIHLGSDAFAALALRVAATAARFLGDRTQSRPPQLKRIRPLKGAIDVEFDHVKDGLYSGHGVHGFSILNAEGGEERAIYRASLCGNRVRLYLSGSFSHEGCQVVYGFGYAPSCNIFDGRSYSLPAFGPIPVGKPRAWLPYVTTWKSSDVLAPAAAPLESITLVSVACAPMETRDFRSFITGFVSGGERWRGKQGMVLMASRLELPEPMTLEFRMGYDGPFRLWVDGEVFFTDPGGTNPAVPDAKRKLLRLDKGIHDLHVLMDLNGGRAEGFFLRFVRTDVSSKAARSGTYAKPVYLI